MSVCVVVGGVAPPPGDPQGEWVEQLRLQEALRVSVCIVVGGAAPPPGGPQGECV